MGGIWYPRLKSHLDYAIAKQKMVGYVGVNSFEFDVTLETTGRFIHRLLIPVIAPSFGGVETPVEQPALMSPKDKSPQDRLELCIKDNRVRLVVGAKDTADLRDEPAVVGMLGGLMTDRPLSVIPVGASND